MNVMIVWMALLTTAPSGEPPAGAAAIGVPDEAMPLNSPGDWLTTDDYPGYAIRQNEEGKVRFRLSVGQTGAPISCEILISSGSKTLDAATCRLAKARMKFAPAGKSDGRDGLSSWTGMVNWSIPKRPSATMLAIRRPGGTGAYECLVSYVDAADTSLDPVTCARLGRTMLPKGEGPVTQNFPN